MDYELKKKGSYAILIYIPTEKNEYKITCVDVAQKLLGVSAIDRNDKIRIPFSRVSNFDIEFIKKFVLNVLFKSKLLTKYSSGLLKAQLA